MTIPNILSLIRLTLSFIIGYLLFTNQKIPALVLIFIAWVTDLLDGYLARKLNVITELGKILDPVADKTLILVIVLSLLLTKKISITIGIIIIARDIIILTAGLIAARKHKFVIPSNVIGKISAFIIGSILFIILLFPNIPFKKFFETLILFVVLLSLILYSFYYFNWIKKLKSS